MSSGHNFAHRVLYGILYRVVRVLDSLVTTGLGGRYRDWVVDRALRYVSVVRDIEAKGIQRLKILEVGSGTSGLKPYLRTEPELLVGTDVDFPEERVIMPNRVMSKGQRLPFESKTFDVVICLDVLEHVAPSVRSDIIKEMIRVARKIIYIGFPTGAGALEQDAKISRAWLETRGERFRFLVEHLENPLPSGDDVKIALEQLEMHSVRITQYRNANLQVREWLMLWGLVSPSAVKRFIAGRLPLVFLPLLLRMNFGPCYRQIFRIELQT